MTKTKTKTKTIDSIVLVGRRWNDGLNTYHTVSIYIDGEHKHHSDRKYGYDDHYEQTGFRWLNDNGYLKDYTRRSNGTWPAPFRYCEEHDIGYSRTVCDVKTKRELKYS